MNVKQFVMAYRGDHEKIKALLNDEFESLRPVLRINIEITTDELENHQVRIEFNTPVAAKGKRGWLNLQTWESKDTEITYEILDNSVEFESDFLTIEYVGVGVTGGCPAENDNDGCFYLTDSNITFIETETIEEFKEYCNCKFEWTNPFMDAMKIEPEEVLGAYKVEFSR